MEMTKKEVSKLNNEHREDFIAEWKNFIKEENEDFKKSTKNIMTRLLFKPVHTKKEQYIAYIFFLHGRLFELKGKRVAQICEEIKH